MKELIDRNTAFSVAPNQAALKMALKGIDVRDAGMCRPAVPQVPAARIACYRLDMARLAPPAHFRTPTAASQSAVTSTRPGPRDETRRVSAGNCGRTCAYRDWILRGPGNASRKEMARRQSRLGFH